MKNCGWRIPAESGSPGAEAVLAVATPRTVALRQGAVSIELTAEQLGELADRAYYLHELMRTDLTDIAEGLQPTW